jgi:uncharacterized spore protein YtfJ
MERAGKSEACDRRRERRAMALRELVGSATEAANVKRVFGQPIEREGMTVIPVASVRGGFGGGEGEAGARPARGAEAGAKPASWGGGGAWSATPVGVYVIKDGELSWQPAVDSNRAILIGCLTGIVALLVLRSIARSAVKRR